MKQLYIILMLIFSFSVEAQSQGKNQASFGISYNQVEIRIQHIFIYETCWAEVFTGLGNQDIEPAFNDFLAGARLGYSILNINKNKLDITTGLGTYFPNNDYYTATTIFFNAGARYSRYLGKNKKHSFNFSIGVQKGERQYKQTYSTNDLSIATVDRFKLTPLYVSVGYAILL